MSVFSGILPDLRIRYFLLPSIFLLIFLTTCSKQPAQSSDVLCITGSADMTYVMDAWIRSYEQKTGKKAAFEARGNGTVYKDLTDGRCKAGVMTRLMTDSETERLIKITGSLPDRFPVASDPVAVTVFESHPHTNPSRRSLTVLQARDLFTKGKFTEKGGIPDFVSADKNVIVMGQNSSNEIYRFVKESLLNNEDFADTVLEKAGAAAIKAESHKLAKRKQPFLVFSYMRLSEAGDGHAPVQLVTGSGTEFSLRRIVYFYTLKADDPEVNPFLQHILSEPEQGRLAVFGFRPARN